MKRPLLIALAVATLAAGTLSAFESWANTNQRLEDASKNISNRKIPGRTMGLLVPADERDDILPLTAMAYRLASKASFQTVLVLMQAPSGAQLDGLAVPAINAFDTEFGRFVVDTEFRDKLLGGNFPVTADMTLFGTQPSPILLRQLSFLKYMFKGDSVRVKVLPMYVKFSDANAQVRDYAPFLVDRLRDQGIENNTLIVIASDLAYAASPEKIIDADSRLLRSIRNLDIDALTEWQADGPDGVVVPQMDALLMGLLTLRWSGADHGEVAGYGNSGQLVLTKDKKIPIGYAAAGFSSSPPIPPRVPHIPQERMLEVFDDPLRIDILTLTRQACLSAIDPTASKPPPLRYREGGKPWPVYVTIFDAAGKQLSQAGSHVATGPLEESLRRFAVDCVRKAGSKLDKAAFKACVVEVSIPFGYNTLTNPDHLIPLLNGAVLNRKGKSAAFHPEGWRRFPDPHQLLAELAGRLGLPPWSYALTTTQPESFRTFSFNEKEPFPAMLQVEKKKKKKGGSEDDLLDDSGTGTGGGGGGGFSF